MYFLIIYTALQQLILWVYFFIPFIHIGVTQWSPPHTPWSIGVTTWSIPFKLNYMHFQFVPNFTHLKSKYWKNSFGFWTLIKSFNFPHGSDNSAMLFTEIAGAPFHYPSAPMSPPSAFWSTGEAPSNYSQKSRYWLLSPVYLLQSIIIQVFPALVLNDNSIRTVEACSTVLLTTDHQQEVYSFVHLYTIYILHTTYFSTPCCKLCLWGRACHLYGFSNLGWV